MSHLSYRPNKDRTFMGLCNSNQWARLNMYADDGAVYVNCLNGNNGWVSFDNTLFVPESETLIDVDSGVGFQNSWINYGVTWEYVSYYKDNEGNVFLSGIAKNGTMDAYIFTLPSGYRPQSTNTLFCCESGGGFGRLDVVSGGGVDPRTGVNTRYSLDGVRFPTVGSWTAPSYQNGWGNYSDAWGPPGYWKDGNGLVWLRGLVSGGTIGQSCFTLPVGSRPPKRLLLPAISWTTNYVLTRLDILPTGAVNCQAGGNSWFSLWGACFYAATEQSDQIPKLVPNWVTYDTTYTKEEAKIRNNKLVDVYGMVKSGTEPGDVFYLPSKVEDAEAEAQPIEGYYKIP